MNPWHHIHTAKRIDDEMVMAYAVLQCLIFADRSQIHLEGRIIKCHLLRRWWCWWWRWWSWENGFYSRASKYRSLHSPLFISSIYKLVISFIITHTGSKSRAQLNPALGICLLKLLKATRAIMTFGHKNEEISIFMLSLRWQTAGGGDGSSSVFYATNASQPKVRQNNAPNRSRQLGNGGYCRNRNTPRMKSEMGCFSILALRVLFYF